VDMDSQGNATAAVGVDSASVEVSISDVLFDNRSLKDAIIETGAGVYLVPSSVDLLFSEMKEAYQIDKARILDDKLRIVEDYFDYILIDSPSSASLLMMNAILAADDIIIPLNSGK